MQGARSWVLGLRHAYAAYAAYAGALGAALFIAAAASQAPPAGAAIARHSTVAPHAGRVEVDALQLSTSADAAALTLELSRSARYALFTLDRPGRVVIDLQNARLAPGAHLPSSTGIVQTVRAGRRPRGGLRFVLQLDALAAPHGRVQLPVRASWTQRRDHQSSRLVVTVGAITPTAFLASVGAPAGATPKLVSGSPRSVGSARLVSRPRPVLAEHAPEFSDRDVVIAVDAGHGGQDPGAIGHDGTEEKTVTLAIARALAARIDAEPGMRAVLTRDSDVFLPLRERIGRARAARADLFVSVHADSIEDRDVSGASVYVLSERGATDEAARWLAERENAADRLGGVPLADKGRTLASVLLDLSQTANISASMTAAQRVLASLDRVGEVRKARVQQAGFVVLKSPDMPSMLIETAYISNPADERRLRTASHQHKLANAIFSGLLGYFEQYPPAGTRFARLLHGGSEAVLAGAVASPAAAVTP